MFGLFRTLTARVLRSGVESRRSLTVALWGMATCMTAWSVMVPMTSTRSLEWQLQSERAALASDENVVARVRALRTKLEVLRAAAEAEGIPLTVSSVDEIPFAVSSAIPGGARIVEWSSGGGSGRRASGRARIGISVPGYREAVAVVAVLSSARGLMVRSVSVSVPKGTGRSGGLRVAVEMSVPAGVDGVKQAPAGAR